MHPTLPLLYEPFSLYSPFPHISPPVFYPVFLSAVKVALKRMPGFPKAGYKLKIDDRMETKAPVNFVDLV